MLRYEHTFPSVWILMGDLWSSIQDLSLMCGFGSPLCMSSREMGLAAFPTSFHCVCVFPQCVMVWLWGWEGHILCGSHEASVDGHWEGESPGMVLTDVPEPHPDVMLDPGTPWDWTFFSVLLPPVNELPECPQALSCCLSLMWSLKETGAMGLCRELAAVPSITEHLMRSFSGFP